MLLILVNQEYLSYVTAIITNMIKFVLFGILKLYEKEVKNFEYLNAYIVEAKLT